MSDAWLVVGLGNPGTRYARNCHNVDYMVLDVLAECTGSRFSQHGKARARVAEGRLGMMSDGAPGPYVILAEPSVLMNLFGSLMIGFIPYYGIDPANCLFTIHDELDLLAHELRLERGDDEGGHNGLRFISRPASTEDYARLHIGISRPPSRQDLSGFTLSDLPGRERADLGVILGQAVDAVEQVVTVGFDDTQQCLHAPR